jgi:CMP-N-acetylneuraminic acid synthetase
MKARVAALVPMRHDSKRVPGKNYRPFAGRPLYQHIIQSLLDCPLIAEVIIDTDSPNIIEDASVSFPEVRLIERPERLRADTIPMNDVLLHDVRQIEADYYLQTHSTNPLLSTETITRTIELFRDKQPSYDSLFSVTRMQKRLWDGQGQAINHDADVLLRTQDLPPVYEENSCIYIFSKSSLEVRGNRIGKRPFMFEIDPVEAWDIDDELDFRVAEFLYQQRAGVKV